MKTKRIKTYRRVIGVLAACALLSACATGPKTLYQWESYQPEVYEYLKGDGADAQKQIAVLEEGLQKIRAEGNQEPPGYHAHLGMLYANAGKTDQMVQEFEAEKKLFPESASYLDFLTSKLKK
ncbi:DUF4810 domain-containing protein [Chromobacterium violaceum]|uniref:DUF4810 domain-containing protein n=1 Tax=Chromobacterium violaceum TaxID=536 RepID=A0AAX2M579_CHRVL|nr:DUF4810 domain-containing protein [Chromobacterium violaceum]OLZ75814.1 DUF4810 domain-containing protein [Chromobacterium violaceum]STB68982.1 Uncharacterised protein [Chromobacterium violaceum]SUX31186.1 Uncharacterised protein [Chromobacterium violaceum]